MLSFVMVLQVLSVTAKMGEQTDMILWANIPPNLKSSLGLY